MQRVAHIITQGNVGLSEITVTLDAHHRIDIAHPPFWKHNDGTQVAAFTQITAQEVRAGNFIPRIPEATERVIAYLDALEAAGRYVHMIWPVHCEIGTWGQNIHQDVQLAYSHWEIAHVKNAFKILKGSNPWTEHYSAIKAEVPDPADNTTQINTEFLERLHHSDRIYIVGEAGSHCVKSTVEHIVENFDVTEINKLIIVTDCMSPVTGFELQYSQFIDTMSKQGVQISNSAAVINELIANA